jgi:hypothetical protein
LPCGVTFRRSFIVKMNWGAMKPAFCHESRSAG